MRGGTQYSGASERCRVISIHPPRAGRDGTVFNGFRFIDQFQSTRPVRGGTARRRSLIFTPVDFNPPAPCGAGQIIDLSLIAVLVFQSTRPVRGGTATIHKFHSVIYCKIHNFSIAPNTLYAFHIIKWSFHLYDASFLRCEHFEVFLFTTTSHTHTISNPSSL